MLVRRNACAWLWFAILFGAACTEAPLTPEEARARGDAMLKQMSQSLASLQTFSYSVTQDVEHVRGGGERVHERFERSTFVQRPNRLAFKDAGQDHDAAAWYDGKQVTLVMNRSKEWVRGPMPGTLDEALDFVSAEYAMQIPTADLLYSNPYEAFMTADTTGGWVNVEQVGERTCDHLSYQHPVVDWELWLRQDERKLPCQLQITYKTEPGKPVTRIVFSDLNEKPEVSEATFTPVVPDGYTRIKIARHATVEDKTVNTDEGKPVK
jgi:hypothetical protein